MSEEKNIPDTAGNLILVGVEALVEIAHNNSAKAGWWNCPETGEDLLSNSSYAPYVLATKMMLMVSETAEAMEGIRQDQMDDKLPQYTMEGCELADIMIRVADYAGKRGIPLGEIIVEKMKFNAVRPDHQTTNRRKPGGKKF